MIRERVAAALSRSLAAGLLIVLAGWTPARGDDPRYEIQFPHPPGYQTLKCDLHLHTVFSDGTVWPSVRVAEAWRQGLDVIAISDHIEYQPHKDDVPTKHGRSYELARDAAQAYDVLLIKAAEITRDTPPGHFNALFLNDVKPLDTKEFVDAVKQANAQAAFVFWNHQGWQGPEKGRWLEVHTILLENKWLQGMEICNGDEYYPEAHRWSLEKNLPMLGNSDIHDPDLRPQSTAAKHRTLTLVFAKERTLPAVKEALVAGRTAVWYKDQLIGRQEWLEPLFRGSVTISPPHQRTDKAVWVKVHNACEADICLERTGDLGPLKLQLPARSTTLLKLAVTGPARPLELKYVVPNFLIGPDAGLPVILPIPGP
jgi:3',5'-nucleoside bisphosphate phosphatase